MKPMQGRVPIGEKYERSGWPSVPRPDRKPPSGWSLPLVYGSQHIHNHHLSLDGQKIAFIWDREGFSDIYSMSSAGGWPARVTFHRPAFQYWWDEPPRWSPNSQWLAFEMDGHVHVTPSEGGPLKKISDFTERASSPVWMPDNQGIIVSVERDESIHFLLTDRDGSWPRLLTKGIGDDFDARPSPDGCWLAYVHVPPDDLNRMEIHRVEIASGNQQVLTSISGLRDWHPRWSPDGSRIAFLSQRSGNNEIWTILPKGGEPVQLTHAGMDFDGLAWSPDGTRLAATINREGCFDLVLVDAHDGHLDDLRSKKACYFRPQWSPAGDFITVEYNDPLQPPDLFRIPIPLGKTESIPDSQMRQLTFSKSPGMASLPLVMPETVHFRSSDNLDIPALLYRPVRPNGAAIVHPHGGPRDQYVYDWDPFTQYLVAKGYTYLAVNYRGGTGYGLQYERLNQESWGIGDTQDCLAAARYAGQLEGVDPQRIAIMGGSYGGYMVTCSLSLDRDYLYACGVCIYGDADLFSSWAQCNRSTRLYTEMQLGHPALRRKVYQDGSPIYHAENVRAPVLVLHGLEDDVVPPQASEEWVEALRRAGKTYEYKTYAGESHGFLKYETRIDIAERIERFLDWYLMPL